MPGYENNLVMAGGTFVDGSTSEFSAEAPLKPPYNLFVQGGSHRSHVEISLINAEAFPNDMLSKQDSAMDISKKLSS